MFQDIFGVSKSIATFTFNNIIKVLTSELFKKFIKFPETDDEWIAEFKIFIENYEFSCISNWNGFHIHVLTKLKNCDSFKNKYIITSIRLFGQNRSIVQLV